MEIMCPKTVPIVTFGPKGRLCWGKYLAMPSGACYQEPSIPVSSDSGTPPLLSRCPSSTT